MIYHSIGWAFTWFLHHFYQECGSSSDHHKCCSLYKCSVTRIFISFFHSNLILICHYYRYKRMLTIKKKYYRIHCKNYTNHISEADKWMLCFSDWGDNTLSFELILLPAHHTHLAHPPWPISPQNHFSWQRQTNFVDINDFIYLTQNFVARPLSGLGLASSIMIDEPSTNLKNIKYYKFGLFLMKKTTLKLKNQEIELF